MFDAGARFEIRRTLGEGGMGVVFEAYDRERQALVALKTMHEVDARTLARFKREFRALHDLSHANIVALGELFEGPSAPFFTMELVRGVGFVEYVRGERRDELAARVMGRRREPTLCDNPRLRRALPQLALAVASIHDAGLIHRDIKPSNVLVTNEGRVVLLDFGLVTEAASPTAPTASSAAGGVGTVAYMSPEQALSGAVGAAADWYSVGVLLFEALTGTLPHDGRTAFDIILNKQRVGAPPPSQLVPGVPVDLDALCRGLLATEPAARFGAREVFAHLGMGDRESSAVPSTASRTAGVSFVGRADELDVLRAAYARSREAPVALLIEGVSGVGKTQLVEAFLEEIRESAPDTVVLTGRCYEQESLSYKAFDGIAEGLARYLVRLSRVELAGLMPMHAGLLVRLFPVLRRVEAIAAAPRVDDVPDPQHQRRRMFIALRELLSRIADRTPLVCFIDDLQWTDADSLILLQDLLGGDEPPPLLLIGTIRSEADELRQTVVRSLEQLIATVRVPLSELSPDEARALAAMLLPDRAPSVHQAMASEAAGHPLFLHALARHVSALGHAEASGASLDEMIAARIAALPDDVRRFLEVVAIYGGPVPQDVAVLAAELPADAQTQAVRMLRAAHLIRTDGFRRTDRIVAYHDRVREHLAQQLDPERLRHLHGRLAVALAQTDAAEQDPFALVHHARAAGQLDQAAWHALAAARRAVDALAFDRAAELFAIAIAIGHHGDTAALRALRLDHAVALVHAGRGPEAAEVFLMAAEGAEPAARLDSQRQAAEQWINTGHLDRGMDALRSSLDEIAEPLAASPQRALAHVVWNRARLRMRGLGFQLRTESQVPVEQLRRLDVLRAVAHGLAMIDFIRGADFNGRFLLSALRIGEPQRLAEALATEAIYLASQGGRAARRGRDVHARIVELAGARPDDAYIRSWVLMADGSAKFFAGRFEEADTALEECEAVLSTRTAGTTAERNNARVFRLLATRHLGALQRCRALSSEAIRSGQQRGDRYLEGTARLLRVPSMLAIDDLHTARRGDGAALWTPPETGYHTQHYYAYNADVEVALYEGRAVDRLDELSRAFDALEASMLFRVQLVRVVALGLHGRTCLAAASASGELEHLRGKVARVARRLSRERFACADVLAHLLQAGLAPRGSDEAVAHLRRAVEDGERAGMRLHTAAARDRLGRLLGGVEGPALREQAARFAANEGIVHPERMFEATAPGLVISSG